MSGFNLSEWAIKNRSVVVFLMIVSVAAGISAFFQLGRAEDPPFTFRTMVVSAAWPGATLEETTLQVTERLERTLQEVPNLRNLRSFTRPGSTTIFVDLTGDTDPQAVEDTWYQVRKKVGDMRHTLPQGLIGPGFNDEFGDTYGIIYGFTADGFTHRELRDYVEQVRSKLLRVPDVAKVSVLGAQDERIFVEFDMRTLAGLGFDPSALVAALAAQNVVRPTGVIQTGDESISLRVSGSFRSEADLLAVNFAIGERMLRLGDIAQVRRGLADPPQPMFRVNGQDALGLAIVMRDGGDILALGESIRQAMQGIVADLPIGIEAVRVADQPQTVDAAINDFTTSLWQAIAIILTVSFLSLGVRAGTVVALAIPLVLTTVFAIMNILDIDLQRISLGALIIALALLVDDAMTTVDAMSRRLAIGEAKEAAATYAYRTLAFAMLTGTLVTIAGFVPIGFAASSAGEYTFDIFAVVGITLHRLLVRGRGLRTPARDAAPGPAQDPDRRVQSRRPAAGLPGPAQWGHPAALADHRGDRRRLRRLALGHGSGAAAVLPGLRPHRPAGGHQPAPERLDPCHGPGGRPARCLPRRRPGRRPLEHLCGLGGGALLSAAQRPVAEPLLHPGGAGRQGHGRPRAPGGQARPVPQGRGPPGHHPGRPPGARPPGGLAHSVPRPGRGPGPDT